MIDHKDIEINHQIIFQEYIWPKKPLDKKFNI